MIEQALLTKIPIIGVSYDDPVNFEYILSLLAKPRTIARMPGAKSALLKDSILYHTDDMSQVTAETYSRLLSSNSQLVVLGMKEPNPLVYAVGEMPTPVGVLKQYLGVLKISESQMPSLLQSLRGCSLKTAQELVQMAAACYGEITSKAIAAMRMRTVGATPGLYPLDTSIAYWEPNPEVVEWMTVNKDYMSPGTPSMLQPKGMMLHGIPGTGKTMAAKVIARHFEVPAFRLDISTSLNRYIGESEARMQRNLDLLLSYSPCVVLIDEVEKVFTKEEQGTTSRMLSQLLWWLEDGRKNPCPVVMTTNNLGAIPPELYRSGRIDACVSIGPLHKKEAQKLAGEVLQTIMGDEPAGHQLHEVRKLFSDDQQSYVPAYVTDRVVKLAKAKHWV